MIGIFDSGIGGLSVFREIRKLLPEQGYIYYSDSAHCPYGEKSKEYIIDRARSITRRLMEMGAEIVVVACNTATAAAISTLREEFPIKFIGMEPAIKPAAALTKTGVVGVLATAGTLKAEKYLDTREKWAQSITVVEHIGEGFVELVEKGQTSGAEAEAVVQNSLVPLLEAGADTIVLGCTHYPFLADTIKKVAAAHGADGNSFHLIDPAPAVARHLLEVMEAEGIQTVSPEGFSMELLCSGDRKELLHTYNSLV
ncbi:MAG: glutamate racemase [Bacteroidales bacterium]|nr:glutamate racemase [Bacteroidales bacterium]